MKQSIGVVGTGRMGANMARRLKDSGFHVTVVFDVRREASEPLAFELGCAAAKTLAEVTAASQVILTVITDDAAMEQIFSEEGDSLLIESRGRIFINCATVTPTVHVEVSRRANQVGSQTVEACMASSITQARNGTLYLMVGGEKSVVDSVQPILACLSDDGKLLRHIGPTGTAAQVKALVNMVMNINTAGLAEGLGLGAALGLDLNMLREVFSQTGARSGVLQSDGEDMQHRAHDCYFSAAHAAKDSGIALHLGHRAGLNLPLAQATLNQYSKMVVLGLGELDKSGVAELTFPGRSPKA